MKAVLISIRPEWCAKIASGEKTIEVRKTRPKLDTPFKCYIYCTLAGSNELFRETLKGDVVEWNRGKWADKKGHVIGEFMCDAILPISVEYSDPESRIASREVPFICLTDKQIIDYLGNGKEGYGWHITDLVIYDRPKELSDFAGLRKTNFDMESVSLARPPQRWCYVEEHRKENK